MLGIKGGNQWIDNLTINLMKLSNNNIAPRGTCLQISTILPFTIHSLIFKLTRNEENKIKIK